jgi:transposase
LRKQLEAQGHAALPGASLSAVFVPAVIDLPMKEPAPVTRRRQSHRRSKAGMVELEIDGVAVKIGHGADASIIAAVIEALKATR